MVPGLSHNERRHRFFVRNDNIAIIELIIISDPAIMEPDDDDDDICTVHSIASQICIIFVAAKYTKYL